MRENEYVWTREKERELDRQIGWWKNNITKKEDKMRIKE